MIIIYATMMADEKMLVNDKRLNTILDNIYLDNKIAVMDEEYYLKYGYQYENIRIILVGKNNLSNELDVEYHNNIYKLANSKSFKEKELYILGSNKLIKEAIPLAEKMILNIVDAHIQNTDYVSLSFPKYDHYNWKMNHGETITPKVTRVTIDRINPYGYKPKKRVKK